MNKRIISIVLITLSVLSVALIYLFGPSDLSSEGGFSYWYIVLIIIILIPSIYAFSGLLKHLAGGKERERILKNGRPAKAKIIELGESGRGVVTINNQPFVKLKLEVDDGSSKYQTVIKTIVSRLDVPKFQPGNIFAVKIDTNDKMKVVFDPKREIFKNKK